MDLKLDYHTTLSIILLSVCRILLAHKDENELCVGEVFNPNCLTGKIILMERALYGQMAVGKCIKRDYGFLGCQSNVLAQFDRECSGKSSCEIFVTDLHIESSGGCPTEVMKYLLVNYECVNNGLTLPPNCHTNEEPKLHVKLQESHSYISSVEIRSVCGKSNSNVKMTAESGQRLNISVISLDKSSTGITYGSIIDPRTNNRVVIGEGQRIKHVLESTGEEIKLNLSPVKGDVNFLFDITVFGCPNLTPPNGAWMIRNGETMEVGCHSGAKKWTMQCKNNQWIGSIGQCGINTEPDEAVSTIDKQNASPDKLSLNSIIFAACSVMIFMSSLIFVIGVCISRQKQDNHSYYGEDTLVECMVPQQNAFRSQSLVKT